MEPQTVLGGLLLNRFWPFDSTLVDENGRDPIEVGVKGNVDPIGLNENGDRVVDILEGLVVLGFAEHTYKPDTPDALLLPEDDHRRIMNVPLYRLATVDIPPKVKTIVEQIKAEKSRIDEVNARYESKREAKKAKRPLLKRLGRKAEAITI